MTLLLRRLGQADPTDLAAYRAAGGYSALSRALSLGAAAIIAELEQSGLCGRGGAAFPAAIKWDGVRRAAADQKYVVLNGDESEPGTFKDRTLMEADPFTLIEAMTIAAYAVGAGRGYAYVRGEYALAAERLGAAIAAARRAGLLGEDILGAGLAFDIELRQGAGAYVSGEETALFASIEGGRGEPRTKPPFPTTHGLFGRPTLIHNVETLANVPPIVLHGGAWYAGLGRNGAAGVKLFCLSGHVARPGVYEAPLGIPLAELLDQAGGVTGRLQAVLLGGAAGAFVPPPLLATPLSPPALQAAGLTLGSGAVMVLNDTVDLWQVALQLARFFAHESCGKCVPCRLGTARQAELVAAVAAGGGRGDEPVRLQELGAVMADASICGLGQTASWPVLSLLRHFGPPGEGRV